MPASWTATVLGHLYQTAGAAALAGLPDAELLRRFVAGGGAGEAAFTALLSRHGPSVLRVCRSMLRNAHDAEDAFQATFLVLAAQARSLVLRRPLGLWLYGVARRVALQAQATAARRRRHEQRASRAEAGTSHPPEPDLAGVVLESVGRLPERFRAAVILCDLEGLTYAEAAERLGWTHATIRTRLARGRERLRVALAKKGLAPVTALAAGAVSPVPRALAAATARAAVGVAAGTTDDLVPASVIALMNGGLRAMLLTKLQTVGLSILTAAALIAGAHGLTARVPTEQPEQSRPAPEAPAAAPANQPVAQPRTPAEAIVAKLMSPVTINKRVVDAPLRDVLDYLSDTYYLTFIINTHVFDQHRGLRNVEDSPVRLPSMHNVTLQTVLNHLMPQVGGMILVRSDHFEVVTDLQARSEAYGNKDSGLFWRLGQRIEQPLVHVACEQRPLNSVLADIARQAGCNVVLDPRITDREKLVVTTNLLNTPTDTAVRVLAELANLKSVQLDNVFFVTTRERAAELQKEEDRLAETRAREIGPPRARPAQPKDPEPPKQ